MFVNFFLHEFVVFFNCDVIMEHGGRVRGPFIEEEVCT